MMTIRKADERFHTDAGWLDSHHTFSFGHHYDPRFEGYRSLRVINDDTVAVGAGFPTHGHRDMEIVSYVIDGALGHKDSMGNGSTIRPGDVQRMSAGTGVRHSEMNAGGGDTHFLQIWFIPNREGHTPGYEQKMFSESDKRDQLKVVASGRANRPDAVALNADVDMIASIVTPGTKLTHALEKGRAAWVHVVKGDVRVNGATLTAGDGAAIEDAAVQLEGVSEAEVLLFDLA